MQIFSLLDWKMSELRLFEILTFEAEVEAKTKVEAKAEVKTEARYN